LLTELFQVTVAVVAILLLTVAEKAPNASGGDTILFIGSFFLQEKNIITKKITNRLQFIFIIFFYKCKIILLTRILKHKMTTIFSSIEIP